MKTVLLVAVVGVLFSPGYSGAAESAAGKPAPAAPAAAEEGVKTPAEVVARFAAAVGALEGTFPELAGFRERNPELQNALEVRFSRNLRAIKEMRGPSPGDLGPNGIDLHFLVRTNDNPVWTTLSPDGLILLKNQGLTVYSGFILPDPATPGLGEKLTAIFAKHRVLLVELDKQAAKP